MGRLLLFTSESLLFWNPFKTKCMNLKNILFIALASFFGVCIAGLYGLMVGLSLGTIVAVFVAFLWAAGIIGVAFAKELFVILISVCVGLGFIVGLVHVLVAGTQ